MSQDSNTTTVTATTGKVGTVTVAGVGETLELNVTAEDMAKPDSADKKFYAIKSEDSENNEGATTGGKWASTAKSPEAGSITLANAQDGDKVTCQISVQVTLDGTMVESLTAGDAFITLSGLGVSSVESIDLFTLKENKTETYTGNVTLNGPTDENQKLTADVWLVNKQATPQNDLAGKELKVKLTLQASECTTTSGAGD